MSLPQPPARPLVQQLDGRTSTLEQKLYVQLGDNGLIEAQPRVVHFGGFRLNAVHEQAVYVLNKSTTSQRVHIINPTTPFFRARVNKKGIIAPGMREKITVQFVPGQWQYYYDCLRLHCEGENILVPLHGYPVMNDASIPSKVDFGICALSEPCVKTIPLRCTVPIQFEFAITDVQSHPDFDVSPRRGVVPPNGTVDIAFTYTPASLTTSTFVVSLAVAQFNFEPVQISVTGCGQYGVRREMLLTRTAQSLAGPEEDPQALARSLDVRVPASEVRLPRGRFSDKAGDTVAAVRTRIAGSTRRSKLGTRRPEDDDDGEDDEDREPEPVEEEVEGLRIPKQLSAQHEINFVLTQQTGKLKPKDLKKAIDAQRALRAKQEAEQEALRARAGTAAGGAAAQGGLSLASLLAYESRDASKTTRQLKEMVFMQDFNALDRAEREREVQSHRNHFGDAIMPDREAEVVVDLREQTRYLQQRDERKHLRSLLYSEAAGPGHTPPVRVVSAASWSSDHQPKFDAYANNVWRMRKQVIARLREAVTKVIVRMRVDRRLQAIKARLASCRTKAEVRELIERDFRNREAAGAGAGPASADGGGNGAEAGAGALVEVAPEKMHRVSFPLFEEGVAKTRLPQQTDTVKGFNDLTFFRLNNPQESSLMAYEAMPFPATLSYIPLEARRPLREGAHEESSVRLEKNVLLPEEVAANAEAAAEAEESKNRADDSGDERSPRAGGAVDEAQLAADAAAKGAAAIIVDAPAALPEPVQAVPSSLLLPPADVRVFVQVPHRSETDRDYALRPRVLHRHVPVTQGSLLAVTPGLTSLSAFADLKTISESWRQARQHRFSALKSHSQQRSTWEVPGLPAIRSGHVADDDLSDSESEDEGDVDVVRPSPALARALFLSEEEQQRVLGGAAPSASSGGGGGGGQQRDSDDDSDDDRSDGARSSRHASPRAAGGEDLGGETMSEILRDRQLLALEASKRDHRQRLAARLSQRLNNINDKLVNVRHKFVVSQPAHQPELPEPWRDFFECPEQDGASMP